MRRTTRLTLVLATAVMVRAHGAAAQSETVNACAANAGGRLRMQDLADRVLFSRSGLTRLVDRMARAGLVTRERCEDDRRGTYAVLYGTDESLQDAYRWLRFLLVFDTMSLTCGLWLFEPLTSSE